MEDYIRKAFKSLEDLNVIIEPKQNKLREDADIEEVEIDVGGLTIKELFNQESSYILTHDFEYAGHDYSLFLEALNDGESCDIVFEEFDIDNITEVLVEVLDSEHEFLGSLTGEGIGLDTTVNEAVEKSYAVIDGGELESEEPAEEPVEKPSEEKEHEEEYEEDSNERVFINGDPDMPSEEEVEIELDVPAEEEEVHEEVLNESEKFNLNDAKEVDEAEKLLKKDEGEAIEQIVDASVESKEDLKKSYVGSIILQCPTCKSMMYKDPDQLVKVEGEEELYNIDEECPHCGAKDGFEVVGQVASLDVDPEAEPVPPMVEEEPEVEVEEETVDVEPEVEETHEDLETSEEENEEGKESEEEEEKEDSEVEDEEESKEQPLNEEHCEIKLTTEEKNMLDKLTHGNKMDSWFWIDDETDEIKDLEDGNKVLDTCDAILMIDDGTDNVEEFLNEEEVDLFTALVERCKACKNGETLEPTDLAEECEGEECKEEKEVCPECGKEPCECDKSSEEDMEEGIAKKVQKQFGDGKFKVSDEKEVKIFPEYKDAIAYAKELSKKVSGYVSVLTNDNKELNWFKDGKEVGNKAKETVKSAKQADKVDDKLAKLAAKAVSEDAADGVGSVSSCDVILESFDEDKFDRLVSRYLKETYSNVKSYRTTKAGLDDDANKIVMEGIITFKSEKQKPTKFMFEAKEMTAKKQLKLIGVNEMFSKNRAFTLYGTVDGNKLLSESLAYRYDVGGKKVRGKAESFKRR